MTDLNEWVLSYRTDYSLVSIGGIAVDVDDPLVGRPDDLSLTFGTHASGYPFTAQVAIGAATLVAGDQDHPLNDGLVMGQDLMRGRRIGFQGAHLGTAPIVSPAWTAPLDSAAALDGYWAGDGLRSHPGALARLTQVERDRTVFGRPRNYAPDLEKVRVGWSTWTGEFHTVDDRFYGPVRDETLDAYVQAGHAIPPGVPTLIAPGGGRRTFPRINIFGRCSYPRVYFLNESAASGIGWWIGADVTTTLPIYTYLGQPVPNIIIDCNPWARSVKVLTDHGYAASYGLLRGTQLADAQIISGLEAPAAGDTGFLYKVDADPHNESYATVVWRDAYGSL